MKMSRLTIGITAALFGAAVFSGGAIAKGKPPTPEAAAQNLSVPTIMVGTPPGALNCTAELGVPTLLAPPTGTPLTGYEVDPTAYYWVQKVHIWQAQCFQAAGASVWGNWGDNLEGDAKLKVGSPIRVEIVLTNEVPYPDLTPLLGYSVIKLEPSKLDRDSAYGHLAEQDATLAWLAFPTEFPDVAVDHLAQWLVHDSQITFSVQNLTTGVYAVPPGTNPTAEINATGKVVYGYNLRVGVAGPYRITFTTSPLVHFMGQDAAKGAVVDTDGDGLFEEAYIDIAVTTGGGGGGGGGKPPK